MKILSLVISFLVINIFCKAQVHLTKKIDPDIVIINLEARDRTFIGNLISKVDSCNPMVIGIDARFAWPKDNYQDSVLHKALSLTKKDILAYSYDESEINIVKTIERFDTLATKGLAFSLATNGLCTHFIPLTESDGEIQEHFALQVVKKWMPNFEIKYKVNEQTPIQFQRKMEQYITFNGSELNYSQHAKFLKNKIVLLGYIGPSNEDKHYTPIRTVEKYPENEPDTYGVVIIANEIRTLLNEGTQNYCDCDHISGNKEFSGFCTEYLSKNMTIVNKKHAQFKHYVHYSNGRKLWIYPKFIYTGRVVKYNNEPFEYSDSLILLNGLLEFSNKKGIYFSYVLYENGFMAKHVCKSWSVFQRRKFWANKIHEIFEYDYRSGFVEHHNIWFYYNGTIRYNFYTKRTMDNIWLSKNTEWIMNESPKEFIGVPWTE